MKTTLEIADSLFEEAKALAHERGIPFRQIVEEGLRTVIEQAQSSRCRQSFRLRDGSFHGEGLLTDQSWPEMRKIIYEGRGE